MFLTEKHELSNIVDTISYGNLTPENNYMLILDISSFESDDHIVQAGSINQRDTITEFSYEIVGPNCKAHIDNGDYKVN